MESIDQAKQQLDAAIAAESASDAQQFQTIEAATGALATQSQNVLNDIQELLQKAKQDPQIDVTAELSAIAANQANTVQAAQTIDAAVQKVTTQLQSADQTVNPPDSSDMDAPTTK